MSYKVEVKTPGDRTWTSNGLRFATEDAARKYGTDLNWRWTAVEAWQVTPSDDPVTHRWSIANNKAIPMPCDQHPEYRDGERCDICLEVVRCDAMGREVHPITP